jgi:exodeoxyribonuclease-5
MQLTPAQQTALRKARKWFDLAAGPQKVFRIDGPAGSGKTSLVRTIIEKLGANAAYLAPTNKAADLLRKKGCEPVYTLHKALYTTRSEDDAASKGKVLIFDSRFDNECAGKIIDDYNLLVIDEASMVGVKLATEILRYEKPLVVLGDSAQLAPVNDDAYFTNDRLVPIEVALDTVMRHGAESEILTAATSLRLGNGFGDTGVFAGQMDIKSFEVELAQADQIICHTNNQRVRINALVRRMLGFTHALHIGDKLVARKNDYRSGVFKGTLWRVIAFDGTRVGLVPWEDFDTIDLTQHSVPVPMSVINSESPQFEFGYAITVHSAQGSEWRDVAIVGSWLPNTRIGSDHNRWWYTAVTRASESLMGMVQRS